MARRRKPSPGAPVHRDPSAGWTRTTEYRVHGRILTPGTEVTVRGERGRFRFLCHVRTESGAEWLDFIGGSKGVVMFRAFHEDRVRTVHYKKKLRESQ